MAQKSKKRVVKSRSKKEVNQQEDIFSVSQNAIKEVVNVMKKIPKVEHKGNC
jgi:hypothetical protein